MISLMFHSAGLNRHRWRSPHISDSLDAVSMKLKVLHDTGFETVRIEEAYRDRDPKTKKIFITFDDGYLDNWVHIFPLLKRYGQQATIFVTPEFVDPRAVVRPQIAADEINGSEHDATTCCAGFLSWNELRAMERSGWVDVQSHALTHTCYFKGPRIIDFWHPRAASEEGGPVWMIWNRVPERKPFYLTKARDYETAIPYGTPIYEYGESLETRRYFPNDGELEKSIQEYVSSHGGITFFNIKNWRTQLHSLVERWRSRSNESVLGIFESDEAYYQRIRHELSKSKERIEHELQKIVYGLCWPGGGVTEDVVKIAREVGYRYFTLPTKWKPSQAKGVYADMIPRVGSFQTVYVKKIVLGKPTRMEFIWYINRHRGSKASQLFGRLSQLVRLVIYEIKKFLKLG